jgi:hypothetical protein
MNLSVAAIGMEIALLRRFPHRQNTLLLAFYKEFTPTTLNTWHQPFLLHIPGVGPTSSINIFYLERKFGRMALSIFSSPTLTKYHRKLLETTTSSVKTTKSVCVFYIQKMQPGNFVA